MSDNNRPTKEVYVMDKLEEALNKSKRNPYSYVIIPQSSVQLSEEIANVNNLYVYNTEDELNSMLDYFSKESERSI